MRDAPVVTILPAHEAKAAAAQLATGFADDPLSRWLFPDARRRHRLLRSAFLGTVRDSLRVGVVDAVYVRERLCGIGVSLPPGAFPPTRGRRARQLPTLLLTAASYPGALRRAGRVFAADAGAHVKGPHWYAQAIAVEESRRGSGLGTALLETLLDRADRDNALTFLVTSNPPNLNWYRRYGFVELDEIRVEADAPPFWPMSRAPRRR